MSKEIGVKDSKSQNYSRITESCAFLRRNKRRFCGAVLLSDQHALTDSSCLEELDISKYDISFDNNHYPILQNNMYPDPETHISVVIVSNSA